MRTVAILARVFSPVTRRQCPKLLKMILIPMRPKRNPKANTVKSKFTTGNLMIRTSTRQLKNPSGAAVWRPVQQTMMLLGHQIRKASCQDVMSFSVKALQVRLQAPLPSMGACFVMEHGSCCASGLRRRDCENYGEVYA